MVLVCLSENYLSTCVLWTRSTDDPPGIPEFSSRDKQSSQNLLKDIAKVLIPK